MKIEVSPLDPKILETSAAMVKAEKKRTVRAWWRENVFNLVNSILALAALIVAILGLFFPKS